MKDYQLEKRKFVIGLAAVIIVFIYILRLFDLQIMTDDYKKNADSNAFLNKIQYPSRGAIYDRNGKLLVFNQPAYDITFVPREVTQLDTADFCRALNITREQFDKRMKDVKNRWMNPGYSKYTHQTFMTQLSSEECGVFQEKLFKFPGFYIQRRTIGNTPTTLPDTCWATSVKYPNATSRRTIITFAATTLVSRE